MSILRQHRLASLLLVAVAMAAFSLSQLDFAMLFAACTLVTLSWYVTEGPRGRALPNWISNLFVLVVLAWSVFTFLATGELEGAIGSLGRFLLWLLVIRLFTQRSAHEDRERFALSTMLVVAGCLDSVQFFFGVLVIVYACLAVWTAMLWRISRSAETARAARRASDGFAPPLEIEVGRRTRPQFRWLAGSTILGILAASIVVFVLFPRFANLPGRGPRGGPSVTGFTDEIRLMGGGRISESRRELFTLRWRDPAGVLQESPRPLLLRGAVLDRYDPEDQRWYARRTRRPVRTLRTAGDGDFTPIGVRDTATPASAYTAEFEMRSLATDVMFTIYAPVGVRTDERRTLSLDPSTLLLRDVSTERVGRYWTYALKVDAQPSAEALESLAGGVEPASRGVGFPVAEVLPIAREILETVRRNSNIPEANPDDPASVWTANRETARAIASWMRANFRYTTDLSDFARIEGEDPIVTFLREEREGHCEFFASGLCAVLRSLGIESRVVTGYIALEYDDSAAGYIVRESNAHAWTEVRTGPNSWLAVDATPEETLLIMQQQNRSFADRFRWIYDRIEFLWNSRVVTYDSSTQATLADSMQGGWVDGARERLERISAAMRALALNLSLGRAGGAWFTVVAIAAAAAGLAALFAAVRRRRLLRALRADHADRREQRRLMRAAPFYAEALDVLARAGIERPRHLSPRAFAEWLRGRDAEVGVAFAEIAEGYYQVRFGGLEPTQAQASAYSARVSAIRARLRQKPPLLKAD